MNNFDSIYEHSIYPDLIRALAAKGNYVTVISPVEKKMKIKTNIIEEGRIRSIKVQTGNLFNVGLIEKSISRLMLCSCYQKALRKYCNNERFDLILYSTPPTTLAPIIKDMKSKGAYVYLMLKDIFPQNAVDLGLIGQNSLIFKFFRIGEKLIYRLSDKIGCMSPANVEFVKKQDPWIDSKKITVCPNAIEVRDDALTADEKMEILKKYAIPDDRLLIVYGGGLGKPQGIDFLEQCIIAASKDKEIFFVIIGSGPYFEKMKQLQVELPDSIIAIKWLPVEEYEKILQACDVGLIMLNHNFKIPNFPSRLLLYMQAHLPILAATDPNTDIGRIAEENRFGFWCESDDVEKFTQLISQYKDIQNRNIMGNNSYNYLCRHYSVDVVADSIIKQVGEYK